MIKFLKSGLIGICFAISLSNTLYSNEFEDSTFIRDAEIEETLKSYIAPLFQVANLDPETMSIHLVADKHINAMATVGYQFILFTGFLLRAENVGQVIGVLAHETGHIADGHVARVFGEVKKMGVITIAHILMGAAAALAGSPEAGMAIGLGGAGMAQGNFLHYHRGQEASADQDAMKYMEKLGWSSKGLGDFLDILKRQEFFTSSRQDPYLMTHPLTQDRIAAVKGHLEKSKYSKTIFPAEFEEKFKIMQAKLQGYLFPAQALGKYPETDTSLAGKYARAIAYYRQQDLVKSISIIDSLIKSKPENPYFWELKAQVLFENGKASEALTCYEKALKFAPHSDLIKIEYAQALIETNQASDINKAENILKQAQTKEKENSMLWRLMAVVYGRKKEEGLMALALAEEAFIKGNEKAATYQTNRALQKLSKNSGPWLRAQDLLSEIKQQEDS